METIVVDEGGRRQYEAFVGPNSPYYIGKFGKFNIDGIETFQATWNWPAFLFTFWWMLYRKMYLWSLATFVALMVPYVGLAAWIACGMAGNYLYYRHVRAKIDEAVRANPPDILSTLSRLGGTHQWVKIVAVILTALVLAAMLLIGGLAALFHAIGFA